MDDLYNKTLGLIDIYTFVNHLHHYKVRTNITKETLHTLFFIKYSEQSVTLKVLASYFNVSRPRISKIITPLIEQGYLEMTPSTSDKRSYALTLSEEGRLYLVNSLHEVYQLYDTLVEKLGFGDYIQLVELIKKANEVFDDTKKKGLWNGSKGK